MTEQEATELLTRQLELTHATWARLRTLGVSDGSELQFDFFYDAPTNARAHDLMNFLDRETGYTMRVTAHADRWVMSGHTQPAALSLAMVEQWVDWMIAAGLQFECVFDGWGTELP